MGEGIVTHRVGETAQAQRRPGGRLLRRYFILSTILVGGGLVTSGALELYFRSQESRAAVATLQAEMAKGAASKIEQFLKEIERALVTATQTREIVSEGLSEPYRFELLKVLKHIPSVTELSAVDREGQERLLVSRVQTALPTPLRDRRDAPEFQAAMAGKTYVGPIYFHRASEPYMTLAVPINRFVGETIGMLSAQVNLKYIWEVVSDIKAGQAGYAFVINDTGDLIAHPDISLVLQKRNLAHLEQVKRAMAAPAGTTLMTAAANNLQGQPVLSAAARIPTLGWWVFLERPSQEVYGPLYASLRRTGGLLLVALCVSLLASLLVARRVVRPIAALREGAARIGAGELAHHIDIHTGDELEALADEFNHMADQLQESYANLEQKV
ncbi:MAG: cache and HAMP domain-containing protein, partial [candidate division NC10 bacterium]|nr:cache and HAMP domain-containing protein [candidate division NC10 bacterium]